VNYRISDAQLAVDVASGKWVLPVLELLVVQGRRRADLRRLLGGEPHQKVLTLTLQRLVSVGLISRTVLREVPPAVLYELTDRGGDFLAALDKLAAWAARDRNRLQHVLVRNGERSADGASDPDNAKMDRSSRHGEGARPGLPVRRPLPGSGRRPGPRQAVIEQFG
jgi:DNA-binding HxlR family transcriptional regulator